MKKLTIFFAFLIALSGCIVEVDLTPAYLQLTKSNEYETKVVINEVWSGGRLVYEEYVYHTFLEFEIMNTGGMTARNAWVDVHFYDGAFLIKTSRVRLPRIYTGERYNYTLESGFGSIYDYTDYEITIHWE